MFELMELLLELCIDDCIFISHFDVGTIDQIFPSEIDDHITFGTV